MKDRPATAAVEAHGYRTLSFLGRGSQGAVYIVRHERENQTYVLKRMHIMEPDMRRAALLEAETLSRLQHPSVVGYRDTFVDDEHLCIVMEYADSGDLGSKIAQCRERPFGEDQVLQWFVQLALALHHVHERGVLHRDLKTQNVFMSGVAQNVKLGDFGIAKDLGQHAEAVLAETCVGTPYYMPPELFRGDSYGTKADVWALGCVLYELLTRRRAFQAQSARRSTACISAACISAAFMPPPPRSHLPIPSRGMACPLVCPRRPQLSLGQSASRGLWPSAALILERRPRACTLPTHRARWQPTIRGDGARRARAAPPHRRLR